MKTKSAIMAGSALLASAAWAVTDNFDDAKPGPLPTHWDGKWTGTQTGDGTAKWSIESLTRTHRIASASGARTAFFNAKLGAFCLAVPHRGAQGAEIRFYKLPAAQ